ncbi:MAG: PglZ domain-containing protein [Candidatus Rokuibacteriota bacterium]
MTTGEQQGRLLVYLSDQPFLERLSPLRELESLGGNREPFQRDLRQMARHAFMAQGLSEVQIDEFLEREGLTFEDLDTVVVSGGGASPLAAVFGSDREVDVIPSFLVDAERRADAARLQLLPRVAELVQRGLGLTLEQNLKPEDMARRLGRMVLVSELRADLEGPEPVAISQIPKQMAGEQVERVRKICARLRSEHPDEYEQLADQVEGELGLGEAPIDPLALGRIDTFRFEERRLLEACDALLAEGKAQQALQIAQVRAKSFWTSVSRYPARHAAWEACRELARLSLAIDEVSQALSRAPADPSGWVKAYAAEGDGWYRADQVFRRARYLRTRLEDPSVLERGAERVFDRYDALLERMAAGFVATLQAAGWQVAGMLSQTEVFAKRVATPSRRVAYVLVDAMRFEMGEEFAELVGAAGATGIRLEPAIAAAPTITDLGMAALLPGAERTFSIVPWAKGVTGAIRGKALIGSAARMDYAKGEIPGLVEMTLDQLHGLSRAKLQEELRSAGIVLIRSQEIDGTGESLPNGLAQRIMGTVLEDIRNGVLRLAETGLSQFVITADHGHLFGARRGDDMKIDPPEGGSTADLHRRCWVGRGGSTPPACARIAGRDLGYDTDLDLVVPKGTGVFKAGGDLAFHHGGLSLQELVIPVLSFELQGRKAARRHAGGDPLALEGVPAEITNRIFSLSIHRTQLDLLEQLRVRILAIAPEDGHTVGQAAFSTAGWDPESRVLTIGVEPVSVGIQLDDDTVTELRVLIVEVGTDRTIKDTPPIPVRLLR